MIDSLAVSVYTYSGRLHLSPKFPGLSTQIQFLNEKFVSLGLWAIAIRDGNEESCKYLRQNTN